MQQRRVNLHSQIDDLSISAPIKIKLKRKRKKTTVDRKSNFCKTCKTKFRSKRALQSHLKTHGAKKSFECQVCRKLLSNLKNGMKHLKLHIPRPFRCGLCERFFVSEPSLKSHIHTVHLKYKPFSCKLCKKPITSKFNLALHVKNHKHDLGSVANGEIEESTRNTKRFHKTCKVCKKSFKTHKECKQHLLRHDEELPYACDDCGKRFRKKDYLTKHNKSVHSPKLPKVRQPPKRTRNSSIKADAPEKAKPLNETDNYSEFSDDDDDDAGNDAIYDTGDVPLDFDSNDSDSDAIKEVKITKKRKKSSGEKYVPKKKGEKGQKKVLICEVCGRVCPDRFRLRQHMFIHTGEKPHKCEICCKGFSDISNLKRHVLTHSKKKPYLCDVCGKAYTQAGTLKLHLCGKKKRIRRRKPTKGNIIRSETDTDRPYSCRICHRAFSFYRNASRHFEIHLGIRKYKCDVCDKRFTQKVTLTAHLLTHQNKEKNYICDVCQKAFQQNSYLRRHYRKEHPEFAPPVNNGRTQAANDRPPNMINRPRPANDRSPPMNTRQQPPNNRPQLMNNRLQPIQHDQMVHNQFTLDSERCFPVQAPVAMPYMNPPVDVHHSMPWPMLTLQDQF